MITARWVWLQVMTIRAIKDTVQGGCAYYRFVLSAGLHSYFSGRIERLEQVAPNAGLTSASIQVIFPMAMHVHA